MYLYVLILAPTRTIVLKTNEYVQSERRPGRNLCDEITFFTLIFFDIEYYICGGCRCKMTSTPILFT